MTAVIPARYSSARLEGKLLRELAGKPLIVHTMEQAAKAKTVSRVIVATDDERISAAVRSAGGEAVMTSVDHQSGSDRVAEVARDLPAGSIIVNVQGDEPMISPDTIDLAVSALLEDEGADISTTCEAIASAADVLDPNIVKVITDVSGNAVYFSRSPIPYPREAARHFGSIEIALAQDALLAGKFRKHTGLYVFRRESLLKFTQLEPTALETTEMLEQLRALENGMRIKVVEASEISIGVDTAEDFERVREALTLS